MDRSMALAGQAFAALLPLLIVVGAASRPAARTSSRASSSAWTSAARPRRRCARRSPWLAAFSVFCSLQPGVVALFDGVYSVVVTIALSCALWLFTPWILVVFTLLSWLFVMCFVVVTAAALGATLAEPAGDAGQ